MHTHAHTHTHTHTQTYTKMLHLNANTHTCKYRQRDTHAHTYTHMCTRNKKLTYIGLGFSNTDKTDIHKTHTHTEWEVNLSETAHIWGCVLLHRETVKTDWQTDQSVYLRQPISRVGFLPNSDRQTEWPLNLRQNDQSIYLRLPILRVGFLPDSDRQADTGTDRWTSQSISRLPSLRVVFFQADSDRQRDQSIYLSLPLSRVGFLPYSERQTDGRMDGRTDRETSQSTWDCPYRGLGFFPVITGFFHTDSMKSNSHTSLHLQHQTPLHHKTHQVTDIVKPTFQHKQEKATRTQHFSLAT